MNFIKNMPLVLILLIGTGFAMFVPAAHALAIENHADMRSFFYAGTLVILFSTAIGIVIGEGSTNELAQRDQLLVLLSVFAALPLIIAIPFQNAVGGISLFDAYFEMVSSITTTGATLFDDPASLDLSVHIWRAQVGWMGGFAMLVAGVALLAPMHLGGFEIIGLSQSRGQQRSVSQSAVSEGAVYRIGRWTRRLFPIYGGLTVLLWLALFANGQSGAVALCHAMSILSTSGISPVGGLEAAPLGTLGEMIVFAFLLAGLSRLTLMPDDPLVQGRGLLHDREFRLGVLIVVGVSILVFWHHWFASLEVDDTNGGASAFRALWGALFTVLSFLTTTGFVSEAWESTTAWSGLAAPGMVLVGLAVIGGGVATTAGGVKLLRIYALWGHGRREIERLVYPSTIGQGGHKGRRVSMEGAQIAWVFFMLYAISIAAVVTLLSVTGVDFEGAMILAVSALSTTGPLATVATEQAVTYSALGAGAKSVLLVTMVVGRLETLALIALLNSNFWRQ